MNRKIFIILTFIILIASVLRLWQLGIIPSSPDWDEVALGYNAYSILQSGRDEYGKFLPIIIRSFDDYKPALYVYLAMPSIAILGLNVVAVRLPSAIFGILTVLATFFLIKELFKKNNIALLTTFLLAISPWHIQFSRVAFEANVGVALNVFGILFFLIAFKKPWFLLLSSLMLGLGLHVYQGEKVFVPLLLIILIAIFRKQFFAIKKKYIFVSASIFIIISFLLIYITLTNGNVLARAKDVSIFSNQSLIELNAKKIARDKENNDLLGLVFDNRRIEFVKNTARGYLSHFDLNWLFVTGDIARHHAPNMGLLYLIELPFLLIGIYSLIFGSFEKKIKIFTVLWFLISPIAASVTNDIPNAVRTLNFLPTFQIFIAVGIITALTAVSNLKIKYLILPLFILFFIFNFTYYLNQYFVQLNYFHAKYWQYGYENIVNHIAGIRKDYNKIIVSNTATMDQSYMFFLFYLKYDPVQYQKEGGTASGKFEGKNQFANFEFRKFDYNQENEKNILLIGSSFDFQEEYRTIHRINYPDAGLAIKVVEKNK
ncbi:MAG: glycosyltransferase family 39 protein [Candidatus Parcubacteria bacterium]|nr:glycosyltransferase family 39 protein [Candidatus Parcubacteria bacterium]